MKTKTNLQVPISLSLRTQAEEVAKKQGFSSLQELIRVFITNYISGNATMFLGSTLSPQAVKRYEKDLAEVRRSLKNKKIKVNNSVKEAIEQLSDL
jgi:antitoxin component of RelBE/YafQ-DinJ toxin-antitoxin module